MASEHDRSVFVEPLPSHPSPEMQQKRAKNLLRAASGGDADTLQRIRALHPKPPAPSALKLADAQLVIARGYGFESWAAMRRKIDSLTKSPIEQFYSALLASDAEQVRTLLEAHATVRAAVNQPIAGTFGTHPVAMARKDLPVLDVLIEYGADLNLKSGGAGGAFGILEANITVEEAAPLIARGAIVDIFAAAHLGMFDRVRELIDGDPSLVSARGGDGKTVLHSASTVEIARYLIDRDADIDAIDIDHQSTPAQYLVRAAPDVVRLLVDRGAWFDIFIAVGLRDAALVERCLSEDPEALDHRTWQGKYTTVRKGRPSLRAEIGEHRGDAYRSNSTRSCPAPGQLCLWCAARLGLRDWRLRFRNDGTAAAGSGRAGGPDVSADRSRRFGRRTARASLAGAANARFCPCSTVVGRVRQPEIQNDLPQAL